MKIGGTYSYQNKIARAISERHALNLKQKELPYHAWGSAWTDFEVRNRDFLYYRGWFSDWERSLRFDNANARQAGLCNGKKNGSYMTAFSEEKRALDAQLSQPLSEREFMARKLKELQAKLPPGEKTVKVCDLGCGAGTGIFELASFAEEIGVPLEAFGVDVFPLRRRKEFELVYSPEEYERFSRYVREGKLSIFKSSVHDLFPNEQAPATDWTGKMHLAVSVNCFQYYRNIVEAAEEVYRITAVGGEAYLDNIHPGAYIKDPERNVFFHLDLLETAVPYFREVGININYWPSDFRKFRQVQPDLPPSINADFLLRFAKKDSTPPLIFGLTPGFDKAGNCYIYLPLEIPEEAAPLKPFLSLIPPQQPSLAELPYHFDD